ncbi:heavy metal-binding domain-containing protein [Porticoccus sp. W117]|uniref:YbjQ family protein n=1 Tax=Porticoccus sp. W117 TaxID=3054777 RepID=UPI00259A5239|nr:heavy metal-binding domain-containing protein [Porticoccus sp. W117]MDM3870878.1 heavy metal-binding domain-containing protein [Porticoccus sp. W117]
MENLIGFVTLLILGYVFGRLAERRHFRSIIKREQQYAGTLTFSAKTPPADMEVANARLVSGNVVVSVDYFKQVLAGLRALLGGRVSAYETLVERARREAILRMKEQARQLDAEIIFNVKLETASISKGEQQQVGSVEVFAYGTALVPQKATAASPSLGQPMAVRS